MSSQKDLPLNARLAFKGVMYEIWQWDQQMYDGTTEVFECIVRSDSVDIIATCGNTILLQHQTQPDSVEAFLSLPGGRRNEREEPLECGKRELLEEMGYTSQDWSLWRSDNFSPRMRWSIHTYIARNCKKVAQPNLDPGERIEERRVSFEEFLMLPDDPTFRNKNLIDPLLRARYDAQKRKALYSLLFSKE